MKEIILVLLASWMKVKLMLNNKTHVTYVYLETKLFSYSRYSTIFPCLSLLYASHMRFALSDISEWSYNHWAIETRLSKRDDDDTFICSGEKNPTVGLNCICLFKNGCVNPIYAKKKKKKIYKKEDTSLVRAASFNIYIPPCFMWEKPQWPV